MKCHSVAALWSPSPPSHQITAVAATPAALFTGAADGTILHWPLLQSPHPSSLLCAHAAAITSLCPLPSPAPPCLLASCAAGVLSLFSGSASLRCLRRRSLPPWAGSPSLVAPLPPSSGSLSARVAILCQAPDDSHRHVSAVVVVDARTLAVLRTSFHGALSIALPKSIAVAAGGDDAISVVLADAQGRAQVIPVAEGASVEGDSPRRLSVSSVSSVASSEAMDGRVEAVSLSDDGKVVALVMKKSCLLKCIAEGAMLGEVFLPSDFLCNKEEEGVRGCLVGGLFLHDGEWGAQVSKDGIVVRSLVLWTRNGGALVCRVEVGAGSFGCKAVCKIPAIVSEQEEGEDGLVALVSVQTMRVERMFPGHPGYPSMVAWDGVKGYIACLCRNLHSCNDTEYDVKGKMSDTDEAHEFRGNNPAYSSGKAASDQSINKRRKHPIKCSCPYPGIASLRFDLTAIMSTQGMSNNNIDRQLRDHFSRDINNSIQLGTFDNTSGIHEIDSPSRESLEGRLLRFSLCFLHLWGVDHELDKLLVDEMQVCKPEGCHIATGVVGDRGSFTLMFPGKEATLELWKASSEFCAMRSLSIVSLAQRMITLSRSCTNASSALAAFYTRNFAEKVPDVKPPSLQVLVSFWQHPSEHSASVCSYGQLKVDSENLEREDCDTSEINSWLESFENQQWLSWIGGTSQDAVASNIIVAAALVVWYPSIVKAKLAHLVVNQLIKNQNASARAWPHLQNEDEQRSQGTKQVSASQGRETSVMVRLVSSR
ncbi:hypothetical protein GUJ93_ZPchr0006g41914 [Zizania palustris]|uniref:Uncharacterized protein n=1 Tax=Zizania palustris TaxID=103762 RepID=A0A8J5T8Y1_ZIZPA|nr:hypothetical protein GUJ93_ZPchr0006g41914 [Zizania palustris]